jgi:DNA-binding response OmpR family regulator
VVMTANDEARHREIAITKGAHRFLHKPFDMRELLATVDSLLSP